MPLKNRTENTCVKEMSKGMQKDQQKHLMDVIVLKEKHSRTPCFLGEKRGAKFTRGIARMPPLAAFIGAGTSLPK